MLLEVGVVFFDAVVEDGDDDALAAVAHVPGALHVHVFASATVLKHAQSGQSVAT